MRPGVSAFYQALGAVLLLLLQSKQAESNVIRVGTCPVIQPSTTLTAVPFAPAPVAPATTATMTWYEVRRLHSSFEHSLTCVTYTFMSTTTGTGVSLTITGRKKVTGRTYTVTGSVTQKIPTDFNRYSVTFLRQGLLPSLQFLENLPNNYVVAAASAAVTPAWMVLYSCKQVGIFYIQDSWILFSTRFPDLGTIGTAVAAAQAVGVPTDKYIETDQTYCQ